MEAIVLAGGMGTRLREVVVDVPKPMAPIKDKPFLEILFQWLSLYPVTRVVAAVGYKANVIEEYFGKSFQNIQLVYSKEPTALGTGGAIVYALKHTTADNILIINGDTYFPINLNEFFEFHIQNQSKLAIALKSMEKFERYGSVELSGKTVVKFNEKQYCEEGIINGGIYLVSKTIFQQKNYPTVFSFEKEILEKETKTGNVKGIVFTESFIDIGVPEDYRKACETL